MTLEPELKALLDRMTFQEAELLTPSELYHRIIYRLRVLEPLFIATGYAIRSDRITLIVDSSGAQHLSHLLGWDEIHDMMKAGTLEIE